MFFLFYIVKLVASVVADPQLVSNFSSSPRTCSCSTGSIPIDVDVFVSSDPVANHFLNASATRRLRSTFSVFGSLCEPIGPVSDFSGIQLLLHGQTYTHHYWKSDFGSTFDNYSYVDFACSQGIPSFAYDNLGAGRSTRPQNASDIQLPSAAAVMSSLALKLKDGSLAFILTGVFKPYRKVVTMAHSVGGACMNYAMIVDGADSPFDGAMPQGSIHDAAFIRPDAVPFTTAANAVDPMWANLDPFYVTTRNITSREVFYGPIGTFSEKMLQLDEITKNVGSAFISKQINNIYQKTNFKGPVLVMVGENDKTHCLDNKNLPCSNSALLASEKQFFPNAASLQTAVIPKIGHDVNFHLGVSTTAFPIMIAFFRKVVHG